jgi:hypothetical protein
MKQFLKIMILIAVSLARVHASDKPLEERPMRTVSVFGSFGALEALCIGITFQSSESYSVGLIAGAFIIGGRAFMFPNSAGGFGVRNSYYFNTTGKGKFLFANVLSSDIMYLFPFEHPGDKISNNNPGGIGVDIMIGHDGIEGKGIRVNWGAGVAGSFHHDVPALITPALKLGMQINL